MMIYAGRKSYHENDDREMMLSSPNCRKRDQHEHEQHEEHQNIAVLQKCLKISAVYKVISGPCTVIQSTMPLLVNVASERMNSGIPYIIVSVHKPLAQDPVEESEKRPFLVRHRHEI
ncbi:MAG TPA: hypothetical protein DCX23_07065 [Lachnospiraceae bacterium]|nr:hypothetical protein [Lachnospiraceae bacterium]